MTEKPGLLELFLVSLTKQEFSLVWGVDCIRDSEEYSNELAGVDEYATPGQEHYEEYYFERLRRCARWLRFEKDFEFEWIDFDDNGSIYRTSEMCEPGNAQYEILLAMAGVDYPRNLRIASWMIEKKDSALSRMLLDASENAELAKRHRIKHTDPEAYAKFQAQNDEILQSVGVVRKENLN